MKDLPRCFQQGLRGGEAINSHNGGFGGGGMASLDYPAGGGGFTGGNGGEEGAGGGGGGSFNSDPEGTNKIGNFGPGECTIRLILPNYTS